MKTYISYSENCSIDHFNLDTTTVLTTASDLVETWTTVTYADYSFSQSISVEREPASHQPQQKEDDWIITLKSAVLNNLHDPSLSPGTLGQYLFLSPSKLYRKMKASIDQTPNDFIRQIRLNKAMELLESEDLTIAEVAYEVGFNDPNYFTRIFTKVYGCTPSSFKKKSVAHWS